MAAVDSPIAIVDPREHSFLGLRMRAMDWALLIALWTLPGIITTSLMHFLKEETWAIAILTQMPPWLYWVPATPLIVQLARARPLDSASWISNVPVHLLATVVFSSMQIGVAAGSCRAFGGIYCRKDPIGSLLFGLSVYYAELNVVCYWGIVAFGSAVDYHRKFRDRELLAARLETQLVHAELEALKMQLQPHFLFNTLHAIAVLVRKGDSQGSIRMLTGVSDLLRLSLENVGKQEVALKDELDFVERYLDVERTRFQDRLSVRRDISPETLDARVPNLILQPIVENAIRHGIEPRSSPGTIAIETRRDGNLLRIAVEDDGVGLSKNGTQGRGLGLANVRARLEQLHPGRHLFSIEERPTGGVRVTLEVPFAHG